MSNYVVTDAELKAVADAIRAKRGTSSKLSFPEEWESAISAISSDGVYIPTEPYVEEIYNSNGELINVIMHGYTKIREYCFVNCGSLALTSLPDGITSIGDSAFSGCRSLALTSLPDGITILGQSAFFGCESLALTSLPSGLEVLKLNAFNGCTSLAITSIPASIRDIAIDAFKDCTGLTSITFKGKITNMAVNAFRNCTNLTEIKVPWAEGEVDNAPWGATNATITYNYTESA